MHHERLSEYAVIRDKLSTRRAFLLHLIDEDSYELVGIVNFETGEFQTENIVEPEHDLDDYPFLYTVKDTDWYCHPDDHDAMIKKYAEESLKETFKKLNI
jgi:hypothetical protein